jgi:hypothetical protein
MFCSPALVQQKNPKTNMSRLLKIQALDIPPKILKKTVKPN